jgi:hypothetical protein
VAKKHFAIQFQASHLRSEGASENSPQFQLRVNAKKQSPAGATDKTVAENSFPAPKERRKLASHIVAGLAPANHRVLKGRRKMSASFHRPSRDEFILSADTSHFVAG